MLYEAHSGSTNWQEQKPRGPGAAQISPWLCKRMLAVPGIRVADRHPSGSPLLS